MSVLGNLPEEKFAKYATLSAELDHVYRAWYLSLIDPHQDHSYVPELFKNQSLYKRLIEYIPDGLVANLREIDPLSEIVNEGETSTARNAKREELLTEFGYDVVDLRGDWSEKEWRRIRSAMFDIMESLQSADEGDLVPAMESFNDMMMPRAWHFIKDEWVRKLFDVSEISPLIETELGGKLASISPDELAVSSFLFDR